MGPKRADNANKNRRVSQLIVAPTEGPGFPIYFSFSLYAHTYVLSIENYQCLGRFAADLEICCRELFSTPPHLTIPVYNRNLPSSVSQQMGTYSGASVAPSLIAGEEQLSSSAKLPFTARIPSNSGTLTGLETDNRSHSILGRESIRSSSSSYRTFHLVSNSDFYRPKFLADPVSPEQDPIEQIKTLYMRAWQLDQRFIDILKKVLPLQEHLHTLDFCFVGLNVQTIYGLADVCQTIKNLKTVSLDGNPLAGEHFYTLIDRPDSKIVHLSLRFCQVGDIGSERLANALGTMYIQNCKLLTLTLAGNQIGDRGAESFAKALRYNRTLISLNLSSNCITDTGACALAFVLRQINLTYDEILHRRHLLSERYGDANANDFRIYATSPTPSTTSTKSRSARDLRRTLDSNKNRKTTSTKSTDKRHRVDSSDENRPPSTSKTENKKGANARSTSTNARGAASDSTRAPTATRGKKTSSSTTNASKKNTSSAKEDEDLNEKGYPSVGSSSGKLPMLTTQRPERENPLIERNENQLPNGEINLKGNLVLLNLNLSRNHLTSITVNEFLLSVQYQLNITQFHRSNYASLVEFSGLCRLELKDMEEVPKASSAYQELETFLAQKNPLHRSQQIKEYEAKLIAEQQQSVPSASEKARVGSSLRSTTQRPTSRVKDPN
ncbi:unnamed protein product [Adineta ricciae]|uniref:Uncharacterized protein n=1 Tax=Adineta ricciae TaxID=249248 RepID=A0A813S6R2_ADIRI|nr:unnamed protein product [Adineta ricciae]CAF1186230.1 unnamed protein product [Adineta ricciae]